MVTNIRRYAPKPEPADPACLSRPTAAGNSRVLVVLLLITLLQAPALGQWLETTIELPGTMLGPLEPEAVVVTDAKAYIGGYRGSGLLVLDAETMARRAVLTGLVGFRPLAWAPTAGKVYAVNPARSELAVIDAANDSVRTLISVGREPRRLLLDPDRNTVYCLSYQAGELAVIDVAADTLLAVVPVPRQSYSLALDPVQRKLYCTSPQARSVTVVDADADTVRAVIALSGTPLEAVAHPGRGKIYVGNGGSGALDIIDAAGDSLLGSIPGFTWPLVLCHNPDDDKLYVAEDEYPHLIHVIDCATDSIIASLSGGGGVWDAVYSSAGNEVYVTYEGGNRVIVICGASDEIKARLSLGSPTQAALDPIRNRLYCAQPDLGRVSVIDCPTLDITRVIVTDPGYGPLLPEYDPVANRLYVSDGTSEELFVLDGATNLLTGSVPLPGRTLRVRACPALGKVYCGTEDGRVLVYDSGPDSLVRQLKLGFAVELLEWNPAAGKLYAARRGDNRVAVINCLTDSLETIIALGTQDEISALLPVPQHNEVYIASGPAGLLTVVDGASNRIAAYIGLAYQPYSLAYAPLVDRVYCGHNTSITVVDAGRRAIADTIPVGNRTGIMAIDSTRNILCSAVNYWTWISVIDCSLNRVIGTINWDGEIVGMLIDTRLGRLYAAGWSGQVGVFNLANRSRLKTFPLGEGTLEMAWNPEFNRVYAGHTPERSIAVIRDSLVVGIVGETPVALRPAPQTIIRGVLKLPGPGTRSELPERNSVMSRAALLDISGRKVMDLQPGENDVRHLAPGVYFVRASLWERSPDRDFVRKVVIQR